MGTGAHSVIPGGYFTKISDITSHSKQPARIRKLPVLAANLHEPVPALTSSSLFHVGWGAISAGRMPLLTFRLQINDLMIYWLANPADPTIWTVLERWNNANAMVLAPSFENEALVMSRAYTLVPEAKALRSWTGRGPHTTQLFLESAGKLILDGGLADMASSDIPAIPKLKRVIGCLVAGGSADVNGGIVYK